MKKTIPWLKYMMFAYIGVGLLILANFMMGLAKTTNENKEAYIQNFIENTFNAMLEYMLPLGFFIFIIIILSPLIIPFFASSTNDFKKNRNSETDNFIAGAIVGAILMSGSDEDEEST